MLEPVVQADDAQQIQVLAFVLVDALGLDVKHAVRVHLDADNGLDVVGQVGLGLAFDLAPALAEAGILGQGFQAVEFVQAAQPAMIDSFLQ